MNLRLKLFLFFGSLIFFSVVPMTAVIFFVSFASMILLILVAKIPVIFVFKRSLVILPFLFFIVVLVPVVGAGTWNNAVATLARSFCSILILILFVSTTHVPVLLRELRRMHVPAMIVELLAFLYRYFFVLIDELARMRLAVKARAQNSGNRTFVRAFSKILGMLFIRSYERSERIYQAMQLRGYNRRQT